MTKLEWVTLDLLPFWAEFFSLLASLAWPTALFCVAISFRGELRSLLARVTKVGPTGAEFMEPQSKQLSASSDAAETQRPSSTDELSPTVAAEVLKVNDLVSSFQNDEREKTLVRSLAQSRVDLNFLNAYRSMFGSQIKLLRLLRESGGTLQMQTIEQYFDAQKSNHAVHQGRRLDDYLGYLKHFELISEHNGKVSINDRGTDFLRFIFVNALSEDQPF